MQEGTRRLRASLGAPGPGEPQGTLGTLHRPVCASDCGSFLLKGRRPWAAPCRRGPGASGPASAPRNQEGTRRLRANLGASGQPRHSRTRGDQAPPGSLGAPGPAARELLHAAVTCSSPILPPCCGAHRNSKAASAASFAALPPTRCQDQRLESCTQQYRQGTTTTTPSTQPPPFGGGCNLMPTAATASTAAATTGEGGVPYRQTVGATSLRRYPALCTNTRT